MASGGMPDFSEMALVPAPRWRTWADGASSLSYRIVGDVGGNLAVGALRAVFVEDVEEGVFGRARSASWPWEVSSQRLAFGRAPARRCHAAASPAGGYWVRSLAVGLPVWGSWLPLQPRRRPPWGAFQGAFLDQFGHGAARRSTPPVTGETSALDGGQEGFVGGAQRVRQESATRRRRC